MTGTAGGGVDPLSGSDSHIVTAYDDECCQGVVDPLTLATILATVAGVTYFLRQTAIDNLPKKKKRSAEASINGASVLMSGRSYVHLFLLY